MSPLKLVCFKCGKLYYHGTITTTLCKDCTPKITITYSNNTIEEVGEHMSLTIDQMRQKLLDWNPSWNVDKFTDEQIVAIYNKERNELVSAILQAYS